MTQQRVIGVVAPGTSPDAPVAREVKGSTTIVELLRMFPDGEAGRLMSTLALPCAHCGGAFHEPLTLAAYGQSGQIDAEALLRPPVVDQTQLYGDNSVLRGQAPRVGEIVPN